MDLLPLVSALESNLIFYRRKFHQIPETALKEIKTTAAIADALSQWGIEVRTSLECTGAVGIIRGKGRGRVFGIRVDIDALPVEEATGLPFASIHPGIMHACGHDGHIAIGLGTAALLSQVADELNGTVVIIFQPGEEVLDGAKRILASALLKDVHLDAVVGLHIWPDFPLGVVAIQPGPVMAAVDSFTVEILGKGGHGAMPQKCIDPVVLASEAVLALQRIVSRELDPLKPAVLTVGRIQGGTTFNVIPDRVELEGTVRSFDPEVRTQIPRRMEGILKGITEGAGAAYTLQYEFGVPAVVNDEKLTAFFQGVLSKSIGDEKVLSKFDPSMGGEDFALYQEKAPSVYLFVGTASAEHPYYPLHHAKYSIDERVLPLGVRVCSELALGYLAELGDRLV